MTNNISQSLPPLVSVVSADGTSQGSPTVSCLTITQDGRQQWLEHAIGDFLRQSWPNRELVIVHDGSNSCHQTIESLVPSAPSAPVRVVKVPEGLSLGELRNQSLSHANGEFICQWDDDDRYHPQRLEVQMTVLLKASADACFLSDQLHHFANQAVLRWDDWNLERFPYNLIPGTLVARRSVVAPYQHKSRGEDSSQVDDLLRKGATIVRVRDKGWLYVYTFTGNNTFAQAHHQAISDLKPLRTSRVLSMEQTLRDALAAYVPPLPKVKMPLVSGALVLP